MEVESAQDHSRSVYLLQHIARVGVQIIGLHLEDATPIQFAQLLEQAHGGFVPPVL